jgi:hypothetical protein
MTVERVPNMDAATPELRNCGSRAALCGVYAHIGLGNRSRWLGTICRDLAAFTHALGIRQLSYRESRKVRRLGASGFTEQLSA